MRQYIGARYVPTYYQNSLNPTSSEWEANVQYDPLTIVSLPNLHSYQSKKFVPANIGSPASNPEYWYDQGYASAYYQALQDQIDDMNDGTVPGSLQNQINDMNDGSVSGSLQNQINDLKDVYVTPEMFGAVGDGVTDDTTAIQTACDACPNVVFLNKTYAVDAEISIKPNTGNKLILSPKTVLKAIPNAADYYKVIYLTHVTDVEICGGTIEGDKNDHTGAPGDIGSGHCICSRDSVNVYIHDLRVINAWGDGMFFGGDDILTENITIENCESAYNRRNGISIIKCNNFVIDNCNIHDINGTAPEANIDIEPNFAAEYVRKLQIKNCNFDGRLEINLNRSESSNYIDVIDCTGGAYCAATGANTADGLIQFINCHAEGNKGSFNMQNASSTAKVYIINCSSHINTTANDQTKSGIYFAGPNNNIFADGLKLYGEKFFRLIQKSTTTPPTFNNVMVELILNGADAVYGVGDPENGLTLTINNKVTKTYGTSPIIIMSEGRKFVQTSGSTFKFSSNVRANGDFIICNKTGAGITVSPHTDFTGTFCDARGQALTSVALLNNTCLIGKFVAETNSVVVL